MEKNRCEDVEIVSATPKELVPKVIAGDLDIAPVASTSLINYEDELKAVPALSVHSVGPTLSSIVISDEEGSPRKGDKIAVTSHTEASVSMLKLILECKGIDVDFVTCLGSSADELLNVAPFALVIGDEALKVRMSGYSIVYDIGEEWWNLTRTPAVYAVTVANMKLAQRERERIDRAVKMLSEAVKNRGGILDESARQASVRMNLPFTLLLEYFQRIKLDFNGSVERGLKRFLSEVKERTV